jgi:hypothetical protein
MPAPIQPRHSTTLANPPYELGGQVIRSEDGACEDLPSQPHRFSRSVRQGKGKGKGKGKDRKAGRWPFDTSCCRTSGGG